MRGCVKYPGLWYTGHGLLTVILILEHTEGVAGDEIIGPN